MQKIVPLFLLMVIVSCGQAATNKGEGQEITSTSATINTDTLARKIADTTKPGSNSKAVNKYYPFVLKDFDGQLQIIANIESEDLYPKYYDFFKKHGYEGNGYCWEGHITQILEKLDKKLLTHIEFDPEAGGFFANVDTKENQLKFVELLSPIFSDLNKLEGWVKKADRSRIDD